MQQLRIHGIGIWPAIFLLFAAGVSGVRAQQSRVNGGAAVERNGVVITRLAGHTLFIPKGYVSSFIGYAGRIQIHALLPCLEPKTPENTATFLEPGQPRVLIANLDVWNQHFPEGQALLNDDLRQSELAQKLEFALRGTDIGPTRIPHTDFEQYKDLLTQLDIYTLPGTRPLFLAACNMISKNMAFPSCFVQEKIWGNTRLYYWYGRVNIAGNIVISKSIDDRLRNLLNVFAWPEQHKQQEQLRGDCK